jgi:CheY-like chemotaxis protein
MDTSTVLYVDDEENNCFLFQKLFESRYNIITALSGPDALKKMESNQSIDTVISDMRMPGMSGIEFIRIARESHQDINYYILTGFEFNDDIEKAIKENIIKGYFTKPIQIPEIEEAISQN